MNNVIIPFDFLGHQAIDIEPFISHDFISLSQFVIEKQPLLYFSFLNLFAIALQFARKLAVEECIVTKSADFIFVIGYILNSSKAPKSIFIKLSFPNDDLLDVNDVSFFIKSWVKLDFSAQAYQFLLGKLSIPNHKNGWINLTAIDTNRNELTVFIS